MSVATAIERGRETATEIDVVGRQRSDRLLAVSELATKWGWDKHRLYRLIAARQIPFVQLPNGYFFRECAIDAWLESHSVTVSGASVETVTMRRGRPPRARGPERRSREEMRRALGLNPKQRFI